MNQRSPKHAAFAVLALLAAGCAGPNQSLEPAPKAEHPPGQPNAVTEEANNVRVTARADTWPGETAVTSMLTPVEVTIENDGNRPVALRHDNFLLSSSLGVIYPALTPIVSLQRDVDTLRNRSFEQSKFRVDPRYAAAYGISPAAEPFYDEPDEPSIDDYGEGLPTPEMLQQGIPEGVLLPGGRVRGFLYFPPTGARVNNVRLLFRVATPSGEPMGEVALPFWVR